MSGTKPFATTFFQPLDFSYKPCSFFFFLPVFVAIAERTRNKRRRARKNNPSLPPK
ncbi:MAG: hypothetical protein RXP92_00205 [Candidatus Micrarchaeota archaeon]